MQRGDGWIRYKITLTSKDACSKSEQRGLWRAFAWWRGTFDRHYLSHLEKWCSNSRCKFHWKKAFSRSHKSINFIIMLIAFFYYYVAPHDGILSDMLLSTPQMGKIKCYEVENKRIVWCRLDWGLQGCEFAPTQCCTLPIMKLFHGRGLSVPPN